uniref:SFRICE_012986 n=1 Tax=Spodoptera frugiperda TaxID=7108 RepID=A0A2H1WHW3_SPOFR
MEARTHAWSHASPSAERREHLYKILVIGELGTGKTSIIKRYVHQFFSQHYRATIGVDFALKVLNWDANTIIRLQLWDIAEFPFVNNTLGLCPSYLAASSHYLIDLGELN